MNAPTSITDYLRLYGSALGDRVLKQFPALHDPGNPVWPALRQLKRRPFRAQELAIMGTAKKIQEARCAAVVAECGTGKTLISLGSVLTHAQARRFTALALCHCDHKMTVWPVFASQRQRQRGRLVGRVSGRGHRLDRMRYRSPIAQQRS
jgi:hypothetical protein